MNKTIHKISTIWQISYWLLIVFLIFGIIDIAWIVIGYSFFDTFLAAFSILPHLIVTAVSSICIIFFLKALLGVHIVTSSDGLEYHGVGFHMKSSWENMEQIKLAGIVATLGIGAEFIILNKQPEILSVSWYRKLLYSRKDDGIPLSEFGQWRHTSLGNEIRKYAPRLLG